MSKDKRKYSLAYFEKDNQELNISKINKIYVAFFNFECTDYKGSSMYCSSDNSSESIPSSLLDLYKKFERNITTIWGESSYAYNNIENNKSMLCIYLKYWLYDQLIERQVNQDDFTSFFNHWNKQKNEKCSDCECEFPIKEFSEIIQIKSIYDVFLFWDSYNDKNKMNKVISNMEYCKYIDESKILYDLYKVMCKSDNNSLLCKEFNNYIIPHLKIDDNFNIICKMEEELDRNNLHDQNLKPSYEQSSKSVTHDLAPDSTNDGKSTGIIISSLSVGTVGFLFLLYKFTPLRSMLDPRIRKTKKNLKNEVQGSNELQSYEYDFYSPDMHFNRYNIGY